MTFERFTLPPLPDVAADTAPDLPAASALADYVAGALAAQVRFTLRETEDVAGDLALLRDIAALIAAWPGGNLITATVRELGGARRKVRWYALATPELRRAVAHLLAADAQRVREPEPWA